MNYHVLDIFSLLIYKNVQEQDKIFDPETKRILAKTTRVFRLNRFTGKRKLIDSRFVIFKNDQMLSFPINEMTNRREVMNFLNLYDS